MVVSWNGRLTDDGVVALPVTDALFLRGEGVFETIRAEGGRLLHWNRHYERLRFSSEVMGLFLPAADVLENRAVEVMKANQLKSARVRMTLGNEVLVTAEPLVERPVEAKAAITDVPVNEKSPLAMVKGTSYAENMWFLRASGADDVLRPNMAGNLCEGCISNVFFVRNGEVHTPSLECGCLPGVMRGVILDEITVTEGSWPIDLLAEADEVWLSNAIWRIRWVGSLDGRKMAPPGPLFRELSESLAAKGKA